MSDNELALFLSFVKNSERYLEFGTGGSTFVASSQVKSWIISIDSSRHWHHQVTAACSQSRVKPELLFADIGPTGEWGTPIDPATRERWPSYHESVWNVSRSGDADLYLVDGRFRVACVAQIVLHCSPTAIIGVHDFASRPQYHCVREIAREIATAEDMSFFQPLPNVRDRAAQLLHAFKQDPA